MHGRNPLLTGRSQTPALQALGLQGGGVRVAGFRNLFKPAPQQKYSGGGLVERARQGDEVPLRTLMRKLAGRVARRETWPDTLASADPQLQAFENPNIPAGYTYFLQLMAHDLIDSEVSLAEAGAGRSGFANTRVEPLSLDTIYGGGPDNTPQAYEFDRLVRQSSGGVPRTRLRLGRIGNPAIPLSQCPFRDLARAVPIDVDDAGLNATEMLDLAETGRKPWRTEVLIADVRNDSHALISQMTVLFHLLHNHVLGLLGAASSDPIQAYRRFMCARLAVTMIYRNIIVRDVMARVLHRDVYRRYVTDRQPLLEDPPADAIDELYDMPLEFSHGAFRFGHAMTRNDYRVNSAEPLAFDRAIDQSSMHGPNSLPVNETWHVDWSMFFQTGAMPPNWSVRIGPNGAGPLLNTSLFPPMNADLDREGVPNRDFVSACYADLWSAPALHTHLRSLPGMSTIVPDYEVWKAPLRAWLGRNADDFTAADLDNLVADPPLPFFVMFEAGHVLDGGVPRAAGGGQRLGPVGSLIVAETIFGSLQRNPIGYEADGTTLPAQIAAVCKALLNDETALTVIPDIADMAALLQFMKNGGAINLPGPA